MSNNFEHRLFHMAKKEKIVLPVDFDNRIEILLKNLPQHKKTRKMSVKAAIILAAALTFSISVTTFAAVSLYQQRMEAINKEKLEQYFADIYKGGSADTKTRSYIGTEEERMKKLEQSYRNEGLFPKSELMMIDKIEDYKGKGIAFLPQRNTFFLPECEMTDEELLQIIDFEHKRNYSLEKMNELIGLGEIPFPELEKEDVTPTDQSVLGSDAVWEPTQALTIPYEGDLDISAITIGKNEIYLSGWDGEIHKMKIGSGQSNLFFNDFGELEVRIDCMTQSNDNILYIGLRRYDQSGNPQSSEVWSIDSTGKILKKLNISQILQEDGFDQTFFNIIKQIAVDELGYIYLRIQGGDILSVFDLDGNLISHIKNDEYTSHLQGGIGIGKDGKAYTYVTSKNSDHIGIASIDPVGGKLEQIYTGILPDKVLPLDIIAQGTDTDFIFWGYEGIFTYNIGDPEAKQLMHSYEAPCQWEGSKATVLPDGRIVFCEKIYNTIQHEYDPTKERTKPDATTFYYVVTDSSVTTDKETKASR